jgi:pimeloyl-ACP methyl ester carboxylesterase
LAETPTIVELSVVVGELRLWYQTTGRGSPVLLVHGLGAASEHWTLTMQALAARHRVIALDLPGSGRSGRSAQLPTLAAAADLITRFLDALDIDQSDLIGNSLGALICLETAVRHRERVRRLVVSNSVGFGHEIHWFWRLASVRPIGRVLFELNRWLALRGMISMFDRAGGLDRPARSRTRRWVARPDLGATLAEATRAGVSLWGQRAVIDRRGALATLAVPTLIVWGGRDPIVPSAHGKAAAEAIPGARFALIDEAGHQPHLEQPVRFNRLVLDFLAEAS